MPIEIMPAKITGVIIETGTGNTSPGDSIRRIWQAPVSLNIKAVIYPDKDANIWKNYKLYCGIKSKEKLIDEGFEFTHGAKGCGDKKNPCSMNITLQSNPKSDETYAFRVNISKPGNYLATMGKTKESEDASETFSVVEKFEE